MACCEDCATKSLGLSGFGLGDLTPAYSSFRVGFHVGVIIDPFSWGDTQAIEKVRSAIEDCMWGSNAFYDLSVQLIDNPTENYLIVSGKTVFDFSDKEDIGGYIWQQLSSCGISNIKSRDAVVIDAIPAQYAGQSGVQQPITYVYGDPNKPPKAKCDWATSKSWTDYLACQLDVTTSTAVTVGVVAALVGVIAISKLAK